MILISTPRSLRVPPLLLAPLPLLGVRDRDDLPRALDPRQGEQVVAAVAELVAGLEGVVRPYHRQVAVLAHFGIVHHLDPRLATLANGIDEVLADGPPHEGLALAVLPDRQEAGV